MPETSGEIRPDNNDAVGNATRFAVVGAAITAIGTDIAAFWASNEILAANKPDKAVLFGLIGGVALIVNGLAGKIYRVTTQNSHARDQAQQELATTVPLHESSEL